MMTSTGEMSEPKVLKPVTPARAERFLLDLANYEPMGSTDNELLMIAVMRTGGPKVQRVRTAAGRIKKLYPEMVAPFFDAFDDWVHVLYWTQISLRRAWKAPDERSRNWYLYEMRRQYYEAAKAADNRRLSKGYETPKVLVPVFDGPAYEEHQRSAWRYLAAPPQLTPFEVAASYFQFRVAHRAKYCANSGCCSPYFIAPPAKARKYCSVKCSNDADAKNKHESYMRKKSGKGMLL